MIAKLIFVFFTMSLGACQVQHPSDRISYLIKTLNDDPDVEHMELTPSVVKLVDCGLDAISPMLDLVQSDDIFTRMRSLHVIEAITIKMYGFIPGRGWSDSDGEAKWKRFWQDLGGLSVEQKQEDREKSIALWRQWCRSLLPAKK